MRRAGRPEPQPGRCWRSTICCWADEYVRATVLFTLVLFLVAMGERFKVRRVRIAANTVADGLLADGLYAVSTLARL